MKNTGINKGIIYHPADNKVMQNIFNYIIGSQVSFCEQVNAAGHPVNEAMYYTHTVS